jgi:long-chain acyl-CoA synthetase
VAGGNLAGLLDGPATWSSLRPAVVVGDEVVRDWAGLADAVARRAGALASSLGVAPGDAVALFADNGPAYLEVLYAIWHAGAVAVPISSRLHPRETADLLGACRARACFVSGSLGDGLDAPCPVVAIEDPVPAGAEPVAPVPRALGDDAWIFFTSGTTGRAKGARLSHGALLAMSAAYYADVAAVGPADAMIHTAALSHASGLIGIPFVARGAAQVLPASGGFDLGELVELVAAQERATFFLPPVLLRRLCASEHAGRLATDRIASVLVGAAPVLPGDLRDGVGALGPVVWNGYGQGESPCTITAHAKDAVAAAVRDGDEDALASVGVARFSCRVRVVDEEDREVPPGEVGEVVVDGPTVMSGYLDQPEASAAALRGGWLHTGDLGRMDDARRLTLLDRAKDMIITGGYNVYSQEVEQVLVAAPGVEEVAVVGLPDAEWGERVAAFVVPSAGAPVDPAALDALCLERIARHKRPKEYHVVDALPRNTVGKVLKRELRARAEALDGAR